MILFPSIGFSQGGFVKGKKGNDYIIVTKNGYHFAVGPTYTSTKQTISGELSDNSGSRGTYYVDPMGKVGFFAEAGLVQFPSWKGIPIKPL